MRILVDLTDDLANALAAHCAAKGITQAEAVKWAVVRFIAEHQRTERMSAFGAWRHESVDTSTGVGRLRDEWEC
jgi:hypothetical protein